MSSGSELLQHFRRQQSKAPIAQSQKRVSIRTGIDDASVVNEKEKLASAIIDTTIEVCLGPDCSGSGGGATLLEIEELVSCHHEILTNTPKVVPGGCRDFCTMGPNVHIRGNIIVGDMHHSKVNNPEACRAVIATMLKQKETTAISISAASQTGQSSTLTLLRRREDGKRWRSHREKVLTERRLQVKERTK